jgi:hypothetical protein
MVYKLRQQEEMVRYGIGDLAFMIILGAGFPSPYLPKLEKILTGKWWV